jgi:hypothetical protein
MGNFRANLHFTMPHVVRISLVLTSLFFPASMKVHNPLLGLLFFQDSSFPYPPSVYSGINAPVLICAFKMQGVLFLVGLDD